MILPDPDLTPPPALTPADVRPTVAQVAILLRTRTFSGFSGGEDTGVFSADTRPTADDVEDVIDHALDEVLAQLPGYCDLTHHAGIRRVIVLRSAAVVEASFFRDTVAPAGRDDLVASFLADLRALQAVIPQDVAIAYGLSEREQFELELRRGVVAVP